MLTQAVLMLAYQLNLTGKPNLTKCEMLTKLERQPNLTRIAVLNR